MSKEKFGAVDCGLWSHREFKILDDDSKLLFLYLKTCKHQNMIGCFHLPIGYIISDIKWPEKKVEQTLSKLFAKGFARHCEGSEYVLLPKHLTKHPLQNINQVKGAEKLFNDIPKDFIYINDLAEILMSYETLSEPFANRLETLCNSVSVSVSVTETITSESKDDSQAPTAVFVFKKSLLDLGVDESVANDFLSVRKTKRLTNTKTAFNSLVKQIEKSGMTASEVITLCTENSWGGFKTEWLQKNNDQKKSNSVEIKSLSDSKLMTMCEDSGISTVGKTRWQMIDLMEARA